MSDMYQEILVKKPMSIGAKLAKGLIAVLTVVCLFGGMIMPLLFIGAIVFGLLMYFVMPKLDVEYEYLYVNGSFDIDAIYSKQKRKKVGSYEASELEIVAPEKSHALDSYLNRNDAKIKDFTSNDPHAKKYIMVFNQEKGRVIIKVELNAEILNDLRRMAPRKVNLM